MRMPYELLRHAVIADAAFRFSLSLSSFLPSTTMILIFIFDAMIFYYCHRHMMPKMSSRRTRAPRMRAPDRLSILPLHIINIEDTSACYTLLLLPVVERLFVCAKRVPRVHAAACFTRCCC